MARETNCPACGAPLEYSGNQDVVICGFCGAKLEVQEEADQARFQILEKPAPQSEILAQPVSPKVVRDAEDVKFDFGNPVAFEPDQPESSGAQVYAGSVPTPPVYSQVSGPSLPARPTNWGRWIAIGAVVLVGLCALCACAAVAIFAANGSSWFGY
jgi:hypothetical protein